MDDIGSEEGKLFPPRPPPLRLFPSFCLPLLFFSSPFLLPRVVLSLIAPYSSSRFGFAVASQILTIWSTPQIQVLPREEENHIIQHIISNLEIECCSYKRSTSTKSLSVRRLGSEAKISIHWTFYMNSLILHQQGFTPGIVRKWCNDTGIHPSKPELIRDHVQAKAHSMEGPIPEIFN
jgi:hypothetical protein